MLTDGTYTYRYDNEGNRTARFVDNDSSGTLNSGDTSITEYEWDHRNRLTKVTERSTYGGAATKIVEYAYDYGQRWVRKTLDTDADGTIEESQLFVHDNGQIVLDFQKTGTADAGNSDLAHRYLWGGSVDDLLADETVDDGTADDVAWALTDHLGSVRDLVVYDPTTQTVSVVKHVVYDAYGNVTSDTATGVESLFLYTGRPFDPDTELQNNLNRWYDAPTGRWLSTDPIGFEAGDVNLYRYVGNAGPYLNDASGLHGMIPPGVELAPPAKPSKIGSILDAFFSTSKTERLWIMGAGDEYTTKVRAWQPVQNAVEQAKQDLQKNCCDWEKNHVTDPNWQPGRTDPPSVDPNAWNQWVSSPPGTDPETCMAAFKTYLLTGWTTEQLWTAPIGSFGIYVTVDEIDCCERTATLNVWMYNAMDKDSFGRLQNHWYPRLRRSGMARQYMWWNWTETHSWSEEDEISEDNEGSQKCGGCGSW